MKILIVYATYSSGTETAAKVIMKTLLGSGNSVELVNALDTNIETFKTYDLIIFGSPSWKIDGVEGQPHQHFTKLLSEFDSMTFGKAKCAVFGLGHSDYYINFCGAVDVIEKAIESVSGSLVAPSLRINEFYFHQKENEEEIIKWTKSLTVNDRLGSTLGRLEELQAQ